MSVLVAAPGVTHLGAVAGHDVGHVAERCVCGLEVGHVIVQQSGVHQIDRAVELLPGVHLEVVGTEVGLGRVLTQSQVAQVDGAVARDRQVDRGLAAQPGDGVVIVGPDEHLTLRHVET